MSLSREKFGKPLLFLSQNSIKILWCYCAQNKKHPFADYIADKKLIRIPEKLNISFDMAMKEHGSPWFWYYLHFNYCSMLTVRFWNFSVSTIFQCEFQWFSVQLYWEHLVLSGCKIAPSDMTSKLCSVQWGSGVQCRLRELKAGVPCLKGFA